MSLFDSIKIRKPKRNSFPLSFENLLTTEFGRLTPCLVEELLPGDVLRLQTEVFTRFMPMMAPVMGRCDLFIHNFFVPSRLVYEKFYDFLITDDPTSPLLLPYTTVKSLVQHGQTGTKDLSDYLNLPSNLETASATPDAGDIPINLMPFLAYQLIYNEFYRDENLCPDLFDHNTFLDSVRQTGGLVLGNALLEMLKLRYRSYHKDYFTGALPFAQKGQAVQMPMNGTVNFDVDVDRQGNYYVSGSQNHQSGSSVPLQNTSSSSLGGNITGTVVSSGVTINDLRRTLKVQEYLELKARGGTRPQEFIRTFWDENARDARLQRPEYIGGTRTPIQISEVLSQASSAGPAESDNVLGMMGGHGKGVSISRYNKFHCVEHGYLISILSVMPRSSYFQGIPRYLSHLDKFDFFTPQLANIGEQEVKNKELQLLHQNPDGVFGYVPRYAEYKVHQNEIHGDFRGSLAYWHLARNLSSNPNLNQSFIECRGESNGLNRIFTYEDESFDHIMVQLYHHHKILRKMPYYGTPKL